MTLPCDPNLLDRNLRALAKGSPAVANAVAQARARTDAVFEDTEDGAPTCRITLDGKERLLASSRRPLREADRLAEQADPMEAAIFAVPGFGLGYHVDAIAHRIGEAGMVLCFEPDVALLRAVLERVDCTACFETGRVVVVHQADSSDTISARLRGLEGVLALGVRFIAHPPSIGRLGEAGEMFSKRLIGVISAAKTSIVTKLVQTEKTLRNTLANARVYASHPGINDLADAMKGSAAIVVSAGPSLSESIEELAKPGTRERACIVAAQTVLKPLLERGIRPHFVTALDHHDISRRFYEGLTARDVEGVTLVAEPKANPAILRAWPGAVRMPRDEVLDRVLGISRHAAIQSGATVAHLSYYLARYLGCDPVVLVGQDLAYTDGLYYGPGAAIHAVWSGELGEFRTLEMMETERIGRARRMLRETSDRDNRPLATDEQLHNYLLQFERDFAADEARGLTTIDAGRGAAKAHTTAMSLGEALEAHGSAISVPSPPEPGDPGDLVARSLEEAARQCGKLAGLSRQAETMVRGLDAFGDTATMNEMIREIHGIRDEAQSLNPAFWLTHLLNQTGGLRRAKRDRAIAIGSDMADERSIQAQRIERDADNLRWLADAADQMATLLRDTESVHQTTRVEPAGSEISGSLPALVWIDPQRSGLNPNRIARDLVQPRADGLGLADITLRSLARCRRVSEVVLIATDTAIAQRIAERAPDGMRVRVRAASAGMDDRRRAIGAARAFCPSGFRGGLASLTPHDEVFDPAASLAALDELGAEGALVLGGDWALIDPDLTDRVAERLLLDSKARHVAFAQAPAGLAACALARPAVSEIAENPLAGAVATIGGLLAFTPRAPRSDPIAGDICVSVEPAIRDLGRRLIPDSDDRLATLLPALTLAARERASMHALAELCRSAPQRPTHLCAIIEEEDDTDFEQRVVAFARGASDAAITLDCRAHGYTPSAAGLVRGLRDAGAAAVHVRTLLEWGDAEIERLTEGGIDIISVDVSDPHFPPPIEELEPSADSGLATPWIVPRLHRNEAMLTALLQTYSEALLRHGAAVIEPARGEAGGQLCALPLPASALERRERESRETRSWGSVPAGEPA